MTVLGNLYLPQRSTSCAKGPLSRFIGFCMITARAGQPTSQTAPAARALAAVLPRQQQSPLPPRPAAFQFHKTSGRTGFAGWGRGRNAVDGGRDDAPRPRCTAHPRRRRDATRARPCDASAPEDTACLTLVRALTLPCRCLTLSLFTHRVHDRVRPNALFHTTNT